MSFSLWTELSGSHRKENSVKLKKGKEEKRAIGPERVAAAPPETVKLTSPFDSVQQEWMFDLQLKMQSVVLQLARGNDAQWCPETKKLGRWLRALVYKNGNDPEADASDYMKFQGLPVFDGEFEREVEYWPVHYYHHMVNGLGIVAYKHPDDAVRDIAMYYYTGLVEAIHQTPESEAHLDWRLQDNSDEMRDPPPTVPEALLKANGDVPAAVRPEAPHRESGY